ncbi:MAG: roadblock/LC7 domain-containing protein [Promethearchaeota archaeon]
MTSIVICPMCGAQTEADKKFCPICGATLDKDSIHIYHSMVANDEKTEAASTLLTRLKNKKINKKGKQKPSVKSETALKSTLESDKTRVRPKTFKTKPLGVAKPRETAPHVKGTVIPQDIKTQLIRFLGGLNKLDRSLEASAVVRRDGSLLASAHSTRVKPEMMATITSTLYGIAEDCIRAISGGEMNIVTIKAQNVVLMLRPINEETILLLVTSQNSNIGLISMKSELVAQNIAGLLLKLPK